MAIKENTSAIVTDTQKFMDTYVALVTSSSYESDKTEVSEKMAAYYKPPLAFLADGQVVHMTDEGNFASVIKGVLDKTASLSNSPIESLGIDVKAAGEKSAVAWFHLRIDDVEAYNVYFVRRSEDGDLYFEGGIFGGESFVAAQLEIKSRAK